MKDNQFKVSYNGHAVVVTPLEDNLYLVQVTYQPFKIQSRINDAGVEQWFDLQTNTVTPVSQQIGELISNYYMVCAE